MSIVPGYGAHVAPHVVVAGNHKGGSRKSTVAMDIIVALLRAGKRVPSFDLDVTQQTLTRYIENRLEWAKHNELAFELPHRRMDPVPVLMISIGILIGTLLIMVA
jgi:cellulose biosynthesis protein BcsQ